MQVKKIELVLYDEAAPLVYCNCGISSGLDTPLGSAGQTFVASDDEGGAIAITFALDGPDVIIQAANGNRGEYHCKALRVTVKDVVGCMTIVSYITYGDTTYLEREVYEG